jgi:hypothetical protein
MLLLMGGNLILANTKNGIEDCCGYFAIGPQKDQQAPQATFQSIIIWKFFQDGENLRGCEF